MEIYVEFHDNNSSVYIVNSYDMYHHYAYYVLLYLFLHVYLIFTVTHM